MSDSISIEDKAKLKRKAHPEEGSEKWDIVIVPLKGWIGLNLKEVWEYRELLFFLAWRDIKVRYKQTALGAVWAILQPVLIMVIFSLVFGRMLKAPSDGLPYPVFAFCALLPWQLFTFALTQSSQSLVGNERLISKVYFPRLIIPLSSIVAGLVDFGIAFIVLIAMMWAYGILPSLAIFTLPFFILLAVVSALAVGLWLSALNVKYRDIRYTIPFLSQIWLFATPVAYASSLIPEPWRTWYGLNPMAGVVEGFRWALLGKTNDAVGLLLVSCLAVVGMLIGGLIYFRRMEREFADII